MKNILKNWVKKWFTLVELIIVITILWIIAIIVYNSFDSNWTNDQVRNKAAEEVTTLLERFKWDYWVYPNAAGSSRDYPSGCNVSSYKTLMSCFVSVWYLKEKTDNYNKIAFDPVDGQPNDSWKKYQYLYWADSNGNKYKICYLPYKQSWVKSSEALGLDWNTASAWSIYKCKTSPDTLMTDITSLSN